MKKGYGSIILLLGILALLILCGCAQKPSETYLAPANGECVIDTSLSHFEMLNFDEPIVFRGNELSLNGAAPGNKIVLAASVKTNGAEIARTMLNW